MIAGCVQLAGDDPAQLEKIALLQLGRLAGAHHEQALNLDSFRFQKIERGTILSLELARRRRALHQVDGLAEGLPGRRPKFQLAIAKHHQNAAGDRG
jgi:hypothetical protein